MIKIEALRVFVTVAETGSLKASALRLSRTQSALSMTLKQLEDTLGGPLFETDRKRDLTDLGAFLRDVATDMLRDHDHRIDLIERYASGRAGKLRMASVPSVAALLLPELLRSFRTHAPDADIDLIDTDSAAVRKAVATGQCDIGIASAPTFEESLESELLFTDPLLAVVRVSDPLAHHVAPLRWEDLSAHALIMNETLVNLSSEGFRHLSARSTLTVRNLLSLLAMVRAGVGITILPGLATVELSADLVARPLADPICFRQVVMVTRPGRATNPLANKMIAHLRSEIPILWAKM